MKPRRLGRASAVLLVEVILAVWRLPAAPRTEIPLPEHPRPDFQRPLWINLNGRWDFRFDPANLGEKEGWFSAQTVFPLAITVPFPWGSPLSGVANEADIAWYARQIRVPASWTGLRVFVVIGACDWQTSVWLDGRPLGQHRGGYTPFEFEMTPHLRLDTEQRLVLRVDDTPHPFKLEGKQGYGPARGIWQTAYLEARPQTYLDTIQFTPDIDRATVVVKGRLDNPPTHAAQLRFLFRTGGLPEVSQTIPASAQEFQFEVKTPAPRLWRLEDPFLYELTALLDGDGASDDEVATYFGMRKISVVRPPELGFPYIALNNRPVYLQMALDQSYHPEGFYTFPSDGFMRDEILRARRIGLNGLRLHVKIDVPRKLYWADRLGVLLMADVPNTWGEPGGEARLETESALRGMIQRDYNHPSIFSWVIFNETWGLFTKAEGNKRAYTEQTQEWVSSLYRLAKGLDPTRLVEDNSPCNFDHVATDINSWHVYLPGFAWQDQLDQVVRDTAPGSKWNFIGGRTQTDQPLLNSECGNVWGYEGSTGDVDWSWDYHRMINEFRRHPKVCGWLYTEHHDVINEWNGYYRYDRSEKETGLDELVPGMSLRDWHSPCYLAAGGELCREVQPGATVSIPLWLSVLTDLEPSTELWLRAELRGRDDLGVAETYWRSTRKLAASAWSSREISPLEVTMPGKTALAVLSLVLENASGAVLSRNFVTLLSAGGAPAPRDESRAAEGRRLRLLRVAPDSFTSAQWSLKQWNVLDGLKVNGAGAGYFEYRIPWPKDLDADRIRQADFRFEASAKELFGKDREGAGKQEGDFMRGRGTHDPSLNPNAYPMTDATRFPSAVRVRACGVALGVYELPDDPADHRGILSWRAQKRDRKLREAGSYGYLVHAAIPSELLRTASASGEMVIRLEVDASLPGGLAVYGARFGRYPLDPTLVLVLE